MTALTKLYAILHVIKFFVPFVLFNVLPVWFCQKFLKLGLRDGTSVDEEFFSKVLVEHPDAPGKVRRIIGTKAL
jgi:hypothetical protein